MQGPSLTIAVPVQQAEAEGDAALGEQPEACGSAAPGGDAATQKNWAELYAIVGSLFDSRMSVTDHLAMLQHLPESQRCDASPGDVIVVKL